jgi:hypothetical protein
MKYYLALAAALLPVGATPNVVIHTSLQCSTVLPHAALAQIATAQHGFHFTPGNPGCGPGELATFNVTNTSSAHLIALVLTGSLDAAFAGYSLNADTVTSIDNVKIGRMRHKVLFSWKNISAPMGAFIVAHVSSAFATLFVLFAGTKRKEVSIFPIYNAPRFF